MSVEEELAFCIHVHIMSDRGGNVNGHGKKYSISIFMFGCFIENLGLVEKC